MVFLDRFKKKQSDEKWVVIKPANIKKEEIGGEKPLVIKNDENKVKRMSKAELKKYFPNLEFD